jgi:hypothetical protein
VVLPWGTISKRFPNVQRYGFILYLRGLIYILTLFAVGCNAGINEVNKFIWKASLQRAGLKEIRFIRPCYQKGV